MNKMVINEDINIIFNTLKNNGYKCYMVGGCVRDYLLDRVASDIDFTTNAKPEEIKECFKDYHIIETGLIHGTITIRMNHHSYEITTFREDGLYLNNRKPRSVKFVNDINEDLKRRDFTINAIAYNNESGFVDSENGIKDIKDKIIRCIGDPNKRLKDDALRILRALRFSASLGFTIERKTKKACFNNAYLLKNISSERIYSELVKILVLDNGSDVLYEYIDIIGVIIPELLLLKDFNQHNPYHNYDVLKHTLVALKNAKKDLIVCLSVLFHDIGKPACFSMDENGIGHFYGHSKKGVEITRNILNRLNVSKEIKNKVLTLIKYHDLDLKVNEKYIKKLAYKLGDIEMVKKLVFVQIADTYGKALDHEEKIKEFNQIELIIDKIEEERLSFSLKDLDVNGNDLLELGIKGKDIGESLNYLLEATLNGKVNNKKKELIKYLNNK